MSLLTKIKSKLEKQDQWIIRHQREENEKARRLDDADYDLYRRLKNLLMQLHGQKIEDHKIAIKEKDARSRNRTLFMFVDGNVHIKFRIKRDCRACDCGANDGMCNHDNIYTRTVTIHDCGWSKDPDEYRISVTELQEYEINEDSIANCTLRWIDDFERRY